MDPKILEKFLEWIAKLAESLVYNFDYRTFIKAFNQNHTTGDSVRILKIKVYLQNIYMIVSSMCPETIHQTLHLSL